MKDVLSLKFSRELSKKDEKQLLTLIGALGMSEIHVDINGTVRTISIHDIDAQGREKLEE